MKVKMPWGEVYEAPEQPEKPVPADVKRVLGDISRADYDALIIAMMPDIAEALSRRIQVINDPWGNASVRIR